MTDATEGRRAILRAGLAVAAGAAALTAGPSWAADASLLPQGAGALRELAARLAAAPRRRDFKAAPMVVNDPQQWDHEALTTLIAYRGGPRQVWDNSDIGSAWLNLMRNALNGQVFGFRHAEFLAVSATHGSAHYALYDQAMWDKYGLAKMTHGRFARNVLIDEPAAASANAADLENPEGVFSPHDNAIPVLQRRGVVFVACHNAIWEQAGALIEHGSNPDKLSHDVLAADLTNHLIPGVVLSPGVVATLVELQSADFHYAYSK